MNPIKMSPGRRLLGGIALHVLALVNIFTLLYWFSIGVSAAEDGGFEPPKEKPKDA